MERLESHSHPSAMTKEEPLAIQIASIQQCLKASKCVEGIEVDMVIKICTSTKMPTLDNSRNILQPGVWIGPAQVVLEDKTDVESSLREQTTSAWKKGWSEKSYDFPNNYIDIPQRVLYWNPISTFSDIQNERFNQRYKQ
jgi:hypothetical protein